MAGASHRWIAADGRGVVRRAEVGGRTAAQAILLFDECRSECGVRGDRPGLLAHHGNPPAPRGSAPPAVGANRKLYCLLFVKLIAYSVEDGQVAAAGWAAAPVPEQPPLPVADPNLARLQP